MFNPKEFLKNPTAEQENFVGLPKLIFNSAQSCDIDFRPTLFGNVVLTGGNTLFPGFADRLHWELNSIPHSVSSFLIFCVVFVIIALFICSKIFIVSFYV